MERLDRRRFLAASITFSGLAGAALGSTLVTVSRVFAAGAYPPDGAAPARMVRFARQLFPHDALSDAVYAEIVEAALSGVAARADFTAALDETDAALVARAGPDWRTLDDDALVFAMHEIENETAFVKIREQVRAGLYNGAEFWRRVGYAGPSLPFGGYLNRGAGEVDWLPEDT